MILFGFIGGNAWISAAMITLAAHSLFQKNIVAYGKQIIQEPVFIGSICIVFIYALSGFWSDDISYWLGRTSNKLPFVLMPFIFPLILSQLNLKNLIVIIYFGLGIVFISTCYSLFLYFNSFEFINNSYKKASVLPTLFSHVRFSIWIAISILTCIHFSLHSIYHTYKIEKKILLSLAFFFIVFIHILAVRIGLFGLYITLIFYFFWYFKKQKKTHYFLYIVALMLLTGFVSMSMIPSLKNKIKYMLYDLELFQKKIDVDKTSDGKRIVTLFCSSSLIQKNPILGVGVGDLKNELFEEAAGQYPNILKEKIEPHNQFLWIGAAMGLIGLVIFILGMYLPFFKLLYHSDLLLCSFFVLITLTFLVEATLETQLGVTLFSVYYLLFRLLNKLTLSSEKNKCNSYNIQ